MIPNMECDAQTVNIWMPESWNSIFIPALPSQLLDELKITNVIENNIKLGKVKRVDFITKKDDKNKYMAFVHFEYWYDNVDVHYFRKMISENGYVYPISDTGLHLYLHVNKNPIKETTLNSHQLAANLELAEKKILEQEQVIKQFKNIADMYAEKVTDQNEIINNLLKQIADLNTNNGIMYINTDNDIC